MRCSNTMASNKSSILVYSRGKDVAVFVVYVCMYVCMYDCIYDCVCMHVCMYVCWKKIFPVVTSLVILQYHKCSK